MKSFQLDFPDGSRHRWSFSGAESEQRFDAIMSVAQFPPTLPDGKPLFTVTVGDVADMKAEVETWSSGQSIRRTHRLSAQWLDGGRIQIAVAGPPYDNIGNFRSALERVLLYGILPRQTEGLSLVLHGALLAIGDDGVILTGRSGAGKSTCARRVHPPWAALADDMVLISRVGDGYFAQGLPTWSQFYYRKPFTRVNCNRFVRVRGIFELEQAPFNACVPISRDRQLNSLVSGFHEFWSHWGMRPENAFSRRLARESLNFCCEMLPSMEVKCLKCSLRGSFLEELERELAVSAFISPVQPARSAWPAQ